MVLLLTAVAMVSSNHDQPLSSFREENETSIQDFLGGVQLLEPPASPVVREKVRECPVHTHVASYPALRTSGLGMRRVLTVVPLVHTQLCQCLLEWFGTADTEVQQMIGSKCSGHTLNHSMWHVK